MFTIALLAESDEPLREIFSDPASTDLFYGVDGMAKSIINPARLDEYRNGFSALQVSQKFPFSFVRSLDQKITTRNLP